MLPYRVLQTSTMPCLDGDEEGARMATLEKKLNRIRLSRDSHGLTWYSSNVSSALAVVSAYVGRCTTRGREHEIVSADADGLDGRFAIDFTGNLRLL